VKLYQVDAFTDKPFHGNPAAVCVLSRPRSDDWMQKVAMEMNLSETAFLLQEADGFRLRWFTPKVEVELCGHATLASAHVLFETGLLDKKITARFFTASGELTATCMPDGIELDFPATPDEPAAAPPGLVEALGVQPLYVGKSRFDYLLQVESEHIVRQMTPDFTRLAHVTARGIMVTSNSEHAPFDFVSRFFAPAVGVNEDPVTGSAHCCLAPFWNRQLDKTAFTAYQASERGGTLMVTLAGNRVKLRGKACTVFEAKWFA
jgi:PhzF family phenazine biosynthesis protein